jgi:hypothetical protein
MKIEILWEQLLGKGLEHLILNQNTSIEAQGLVVGVVNDIPYRIQYQIVCDLNWNVQKMNVSDLLNDKVANVIKDRDDWLDRESKPIESLHGCTDVDIMVTPFTNTLPIRRLNLKQGESKEISVVYVRVPDLNLSKFDQRYTCISQDTQGGIYRYESLSSGFTADLTVDENGMVVDYPGIFKLVWKRMEPS